MKLLISRCKTVGRVLKISLLILGIRSISFAGPLPPVGAYIVNSSIPQVASENVSTATVRIEALLPGATFQQGVNSQISAIQFPDGTVINSTSPFSGGGGSTNPAGGNYALQFSSNTKFGSSPNLVYDPNGFDLIALSGGASAQSSSPQLILHQGYFSGASYSGLTFSVGPTTTTAGISIGESNNHTGSQPTGQSFRVWSGGFGANAGTEIMRVHSGGVHILTAGYGVNFLDVGGGSLIGADYANSSTALTAPTNGLVVEGHVVIGTGTYSGDTLQVHGSFYDDSYANVVGSVTANSFYGNGGGITGLTTSIVSEGTNLYFTNVRATSSVSGSNPITYTSGVFGLNCSSATCEGQLAFASPLSLNGSNVTISSAGASSSGYLTNGDWLTFNGKGSGTITAVNAGTDLTGGGSSGSVTLNLDTTKIIQNLSTLQTGTTSYVFNSSATNVNGGSYFLQGNATNSSGGLVTLNSSTQLPAVSGALLTNLTAANISAGSLGSSVLASSFPVTGVTAASYTNSNITVDAYGRITAASNGSAGGGASFYLGVGTATTSSGVPTIITTSSVNTTLVFNNNVFTVSLEQGTTDFLTLNSSSATLQGNSFNGANQLLQLSGSDLIPNSLVDASSVTKQGQNGIILNQSALQTSAQFNVSSGTLSNLYSSTGVFSLNGVVGTLLLNNPLAVFGNTNNYVQLTIQNTSSGNQASGDLTITNDKGSDSSGFLDVGMNSSGFQANGTTSPAVISVSSGAYIYASNRSLSIGAIGQTNDSYLDFFTSTTVRMIIADNGNIGINITTNTNNADLLLVSSGTVQIDGTGAALIVIGAITGNQHNFVEIAAPSGVASQDILWGDSTAHTLKLIANNGPTYSVSATSTTNNNNHLVVWSGAGPTLLDGGAIPTAQAGYGMVLTGSAPNYVFNLASNATYYALGNGTAILTQNTLQAGTTFFTAFGRIGGQAGNTADLLDVSTAPSSSITSLSISTNGAVYFEATSTTTIAFVLKSTTGLSMIYFDNNFLGPTDVTAGIIGANSALYSLAISTTATPPGSAMSGPFGIDFTTTNALNFQPILTTTVTACGTAPACTNCSNTGGTITVGSGSVTSCTFNFSAGAFTNTPNCVVSDNSTTVLTDVSNTTNKLVTFSGSSITSFVLHYICTGSD